VGLLLLLVHELAEVHDAADRRLGGRRHFDQVEQALARQLQCLIDGDDPDLRAVGVDDPDLRNADAFIRARRLVDASSPPRELEPAQRRNGPSAVAGAGPWQWIQPGNQAPGRQS
jgi:hypothetical protein